MYLVQRPVARWPASGLLGSQPTFLFRNGSGCPVGQSDAAECPLANSCPALPPSSALLTAAASPAGVNGFCTNVIPDSTMFRSSTASSVYPDMKITRVFGRVARSRSASTLPLIPGITASVSNA